VDNTVEKLAAKREKRRDSRVLLAAAQIATKSFKTQ
jgi:hypothetical protein